LFLATTINYMDRLTLNIASSRIVEDFSLSKEQYGTLETYFGYAFAAGALVFGFLADRVSVRMLYPTALVAWSLMGMATGMTETFMGLLFCRTLLGFFESGHWPCALKTTQRLLPPSERTLGNSILQSGSAIGSVVTPAIMYFLVSKEPGGWRFAFQLIGFIGLGWGLLWLMSIRSDDVDGSRDATVDASATPNESSDEPRWSMSLLRKFLVCVVVVIAINACWHFLRVWLPLFLQEGRGYSQEFIYFFVMAYYIFTDIGCLAAGWGTVQLRKRLGLSTGVARWVVFFTCSLLTLTGIAAAYTPASNLLLGELMIIAAGSLGLFPCYYALTQEISVRHQGKLTGILGTVAWLTTSPLHKYFGRYVDQTHSYQMGLIIAGLIPLLAAVVWLVLWDWSSEKAREVTVAAVDPLATTEPATQT
jgi:ACS family hexuronate transporter-like MFS transporter